MGLFDSIVGDFASSVGGSLSEVFSGDFSLENVGNLVLPGSEMLADQGGSAFDAVSSMFQGNGFDVSSIMRGAPSAANPLAAIVKGGSSFQYTPARARLGLISAGAAPASIYQSIARSTYLRLTNQSPDRDRCLALVDLVDQGFPSAEIPTSIRTGCRSWLTTSSPTRSSTFQTQPPAFMTYSQPVGPYRAAPTSSLPRWAQR